MSAREYVDHCEVCGLQPAHGLHEGRPHDNDGYRRHPTFPPHPYVSALEGPRPAHPAWPPPPPPGPPRWEAA